MRSHPGHRAIHRWATRNTMPNASWNLPGALCAHVAPRQLAPIKVTSTPVCISRTVGSPWGARHLVPCSACGAINTDVCQVCILARLSQRIKGIHICRQMRPMQNTLAVMSLVYLVALGSIGIIGTALVTGKVIVAIWSVTTAIIAVVGHGTIKNHTWDP